MADFSVKLHKVFIFIATFLIWSTLVKSQYPEIPCGSPYKPENCENATIDTLDIVEDYARCAPAKIATHIREYIWSGAGRQQTHRENYAAYQRNHHNKRILKESTFATTETTILGTRTPLPIGIAPTVAQGLVHKEGEIGMAKGAYNMGSIMIISSYASVPLEKIAASVPETTHLWMQTYIFASLSDTENIVKRAEKAGFKALVVTLDAPLVIDVQCHALTRMVDYLQSEGMLPNLGHPNGSFANSKITLEDIIWLKKFTILPIVVKGVMTAEDALALARVGIPAIFVSNHGGRQLDGSMPTINALPEIADALKVFPHVEIYVDGGIYNGYQICKAIGRGAQAVFIGRASIWGLTIGGHQGVEKVLSILKKEFFECMVHAGFNNPDQMRKGRNSVIPRMPINECSN